MYFFIHTQILKDSSPISAFSYDTMTAALSALYTGMAYDVASDAVLRSWAKVYTESGQTIKEEDYVKIIDQPATEPTNTATTDTPNNQVTTDAATGTPDEKSATGTSVDSASEQPTVGIPEATDAEADTAS